MNEKDNQEDLKEKDFELPEIPQIEMVIETFSKIEVNNGKHDKKNND